MEKDFLVLLSSVTRGQKLMVPVIRRVWVMPGKGVLLHEYLLSSEEKEYSYPPTRSYVMTCNEI